MSMESLITLVLIMVFSEDIVMLIFTLNLIYESIKYKVHLRKKTLFKIHEGQYFLLGWLSCLTEYELQ